MQRREFLKTAAAVAVVAVLPAVTVAAPRSAKPQRTIRNWMEGNFFRRTETEPELEAAMQADVARFPATVWNPAATLSNVRTESAVEKTPSAIGRLFRSVVLGTFTDEHGPCELVLAWSDVVGPRGDGHLPTPGWVGGYLPGIHGSHPARAAVDRYWMLHALRLRIARGSLPGSRWIVWDERFWLESHRQFVEGTMRGDLLDMTFLGRYPIEADPTVIVPGGRPWNGG